MHSVSHLLMVNRIVVRVKVSHGVINIAWQDVEVCKHKRVSYKHAVVLYSDIGACSQRTASRRHTGTPGLVLSS